MPSVLIIQHAVSSWIPAYGAAVFFAKKVVDKVPNYGNLQLLGPKTLPISSAETFQLSTLSVSKVLIEKN